MTIASVEPTTFPDAGGATMTERMAKLDRLLSLVHALSENTDGLTLDEMAERLDVNCRADARDRDARAVNAAMTIARATDATNSDVALPDS